MGLFGSKQPVDMDSPTAKFVQEKISQNPLIVFSKTTCPYCTMAKDVLKKYNAKFECIELNNRDDGNEIQDVLGELTGARTVPRVFIGGKCIGGGSDTKQLDEEGKLEEMFKAANVQIG